MKKRKFARNLTPIIAISFRTNFPCEETKENIMLRMIRNDLRLRIKAIKVIKSAQRKINQKIWATHDSNYTLDQEATPAKQYPLLHHQAETGEWIQTARNQPTPYNGKCPQAKDPQQSSVAGCVADAMAQVVNHRPEYNWTIEPPSNTNVRHLEARRKDSLPVVRCCLINQNEQAVNLTFTRFKLSVKREVIFRLALHLITSYQHNKR